MKFYKIMIGMIALLFSIPYGYAGGSVPNGWHQGQEIYYIDQGLEKDNREGKSDIFLIGGNRKFQANVVLTVPGDKGYSPHWDVVVVHSAAGITVQDILNSGLASAQFAGGGPLFDDHRNIVEAARRGLVTLIEPGLVVLCPIVSEAAAHAPGKTPVPEVFEPLTSSSTF
ncbi:MAG TPA: hypothetical protein VJM76_01945 [Gammaproteobacteria bacterium]|nr:hypothetical protein [Gammaproteobacteria bacterium]